MAFLRRGRIRTAGLLALVLAAGVTAGCASSGGSAAAATGPLEVWVRGSGDSMKAYQDIFAAFTRQTGIKVNVFSTLTDFETKLSAAATAHRLPDVAIDDAAQLGSFETQGIVQQIQPSQISGSDQIDPNAWNEAKDHSGADYAVPFSVQANLLFVRKDWLDRLHFPVPTTWAQVEQDAVAFTKDDPDGDGKGDTYGMDVPGSTTRGYISWWWSTMLWQSGGDYVKSDGNGKYTAALDAPAAVTAARQFEQLACTDKVVQPGYLNDSTTEANKAFETGVTGMYLTGPYAFATFDATAIKGKYVVVAPPLGATPATLAEGTDMYLMAGAKSDEARKLLSFMVSAQAQNLGMSAVPTATVVRLPVNKTVSAATAHEGDTRWTLAQQVYESEGKFEYDSLPNWTALRQLASNDINKMMADCTDPASAMSTLDSQFQQTLQQQGVAG